jgi:hypothetical protein
MRHAGWSFVQNSEAGMLFRSPDSGGNRFLEVVRFYSLRVFAPSTRILHGLRRVNH